MSDTFARTRLALHSDHASDRKSTLVRRTRRAGRRRLAAELLEARRVLAPIPSVAVDLPTDAYIGQNVGLTLTFDNTAANVVGNEGYGPYVDAIFPNTGRDGDDGLSFSSATYLGTPLTAIRVTFNASGQATHPFAVDGAGTPIVVNHPSGAAGAGDELVVLALPFGSFTPNQTPAVISVQAALSNLADINQPLTVRALGGFRYGADPLDNPDADAPLRGATASDSVNPVVFQVNKNYIGPGDDDGSDGETATGPNYVRYYDLSVDIANGQPISGLRVSDLLPPNHVYQGVTSVTINGAAATLGTDYVLTTQPSTITPPPYTAPPAANQQLHVDFQNSAGTPRTVNGSGANSVVVRVAFYVAEFRNAGPTAVIAPLTGDKVEESNTATGTGSWRPIDLRDPQTVVTDVSDPETLREESIALQKGYTIVNDVLPAGLSPGDTVDWTISFQVSDFFAFNNVQLRDVVEDGLEFDPTDASEPLLFGVHPTLTLTRAGATTGPLAFSLAAGGPPFSGAGNYFFSLDADGITGDGAGNSDPLRTGHTTIDFDVSKLLRDNSLDDRLIGGLFQNRNQNLGPTTGTVTVRTHVLDAYREQFPSGNSSLNERDVLANHATITGNVLNAALTQTGFLESDSDTSAPAISQGTWTKTIYAINGNTTLPNPLVITPGDTVTYRVTYVLFHGDYEDLAITDFLPLPIFRVNDPDASSPNSNPSLDYNDGLPAWTLSDNFANPPTATPPATGTWKRGPADTDLSSADFNGDGTTGDVGVSTDFSSNSLTWRLGTHDDLVNNSGTIDLLFTITATADPFADGLFLTNQATVSERNTFNTYDQRTSIVQIQVSEPSLKITKGIVATDTTNAVLNPTTVGPVTFSAPGSAGFRASSTITSNGLAANPINSNVSNVDQGDVVTFAIVVENVGTGRKGAFDIRLQDSLPAGFVAPSGGFNLRVTDGTGAPFTFTAINGADVNPLFQSGIEIQDPGPTPGSAPPDATATGALDAYSPTSGRNILVLTYDAQLSGVRPSTSHVNTGLVTAFSSSEGGRDFTVPYGPSTQYYPGQDLTDTATASIPGPTLVKSIVTTSEAHTTGSNLAIGEIVRYRLVTAVPESTSPSFVVTDLLPSRLQFLNDNTTKVAFVQNTAAPGTITSSTVADTGGLVVDGDQSTIGTITPTFVLPSSAISIPAGNDPVFSFGTLTISEEDDNVEYVVIEFNALVLNDANTNNGNTASNSYSLSINGSGVGTSNTVGATLREPTLTAVKSITGTAPADSGDTVAYRVVVTNTGATNAFDVRLDDVLPALVALNAGSVSVTSAGGASAGVVVTGNGVGDTSIVVTVADMPTSSTVTINFTGVVQIGVAPNQTVTNTATLVYTSLPGPNGTTSNPTGSSTPGASGSNTGERDGSGGVNDYTASGSVGFTTTQIAPVKSLAATSEAHTSGADLAIGEIARYRLAVRVPEGTLTNFRLADALPLGLEYLNDGTTYVAFVSNGGGSTITSSAFPGASAAIVGDDTSAYAALTPVFVLPAGQIGGTATSPSFNLGNVVNNESDANQEFAIVEFNALVRNDGNTNNGNTKSNTFTAQVGAAAAVTSNAIVATLREPILAVDKTIQGTPPADFGDSGSYRVVLTNTGGATAFDLVVQDVVPAPLLLNSGPGAVTVTLAGGATGAVVTSGNTAGDTTVTVTVASLPVGGTVTINYSATVQIAIAPNETVVNTATLIYTSLPGAGTIGNPTGSNTPGASGAATGERNGGGGVNDYSTSDTASFTAPPLAPVKSLVATSESFTSASDVAVGEIVRYRLQTVIPEGTSSNLKVIDTLPAGLLFLDNSQVKVSFVADADMLEDPTLAGADNDALPPTFTLPAARIAVAGQQITFDLGTLVNQDNDAGAETITIEFNALVQNVAGNVNGVVRSNNFQLDLGGTIVATSNTIDVTVKTPAITNVTKTIQGSPPTDAGDVVAYRVTYSNTGTAPAFDARLLDSLVGKPLSLNVGSVAVTLAGGAAGVTNVSTAAGIDVTVGAIPVGGSVTIDYLATVTNSVTPGQLVTNTADLTYTSLPGSNGTTSNPTGSSVPGGPGTTTGERDGSGGATNTFFDGDSRNFTSGVPTVLKSITATSLTQTGSGQYVAGVTDVAIGETVTYQVVATLREGTSTITLTDNVPNGMSILSATVAAIGANISGSALAVGAPGVLTDVNLVDGLNDRAVFSFGTVVNAADNLSNAGDQITIQVVARVENYAGNANGATLTNVGILTYDGGTTNSTRDVEIVEPILTIDKSARPVDGTTVRYSVTVQHTAGSTSDAFDTAITDLINDPAITLVAGSVVISPSSTVVGATITQGNGVGNTTVGVSVPVFGLGQTLTFTYDVLLVAPGAQSAVVVNTARVDWDSSPNPGPQRPGSSTDVERLGAIGDTVFFDANGDFAQNVGEPGIPLVPVQLTWAGPDGNLATAGDNVTLNTVTSAAGTYQFSGLPAGLYRVQTTPLAGTTPTYDFDGGSDNRSQVTLNPAVTPIITTQDFGYVGTGSVGDTVFFDANHDGVQNFGDPGYPGIPVNLFLDVNNDGTTDLTLSTTTNGSGNYLFSNLIGGSYVVSISPPAGVSPTSDLNGDGSADTAHAFTLPAGGTRLTEDFGLYGNGTIGNRVWLDQDSDGVQDVGEIGINGLSVALDLDLDSNGVYESTFNRTTGANGAYLFVGLPVGAYRVRVTPPAGTTQTFDDDGTASANASALTLASGQNNLNQDFGYVGAGAIGDRVWFDADADGVQDAGEPGLVGVPVQLLVDFDGNGTTDGILNTTTGANGAYGFAGLSAANYVVQVVTPPTNSTPTYDLDGGLDNQSAQTLAAGQTVLTHDFGYRGNGSIGDFVWFDPNGDGVQDAGEPGIYNVRVTIAVDLNGDGSTDYTTNQRTNASGGYLFTNLLPGTYAVTVDSTTLPVDLSGQPTFDANGTATPHVSTSVIGGAAPLNDSSQDFGYRGTGEIGDTVFFDVNGDGVQQPGEPGIPGVAVSLVGDFDGDGLPETLNTTTGANGFYSFSNLPAATWTVNVVPPTGTSPTTDLNGDTNPDVANSLTLGVGQHRLDQDFGFRGTGTIGDRVWFDYDADGVQDGGEFGVPGVAMALDVDFNADGTYDATFNTVTVANGIYSFDNLAAGAYRVRANPPSGAVATFDADGLGTLNQSVLTLAAGQQNLLQDFGYVGSGSIGDRVWFDADADTIQDGGEPGLPGVPVRLFVDLNNDGTTDATFDTTTDANGLYSFPGLPAGQYVVQIVTPPAGTTPTFDLDGGLDHQSAQTLVAGQAVTTHDFGYTGVGSLGDFVWFDQDGDGIQDVGEPGVAGVQVTITVDLNGDGSADYTSSQSTDSAGGYRFDNLVPGTYVVTVNAATLPAGLTQATFDADGTGTLNKSTVTLTAGAPVNLNQDFGYRGTGRIGDTVFYDTNGNGVQEPGEPGIPGRLVTLAGDFDGDGLVETLSTTTGAGGFYQFDNLPAADWTVTVSVPGGAVPTSDLNGDTIPDTFHTVTLGVGQQRLDQDFGFLGTGGKIGDRVWLDLDSDGVQDVGEPGLPGVTVALDVDFNQDGTYDGTFTRTTGADGAYLFPSLVTAQYRVRVTPLAGTSQTFDADGTGSANQSTLVLAAGATNLLQDFGYVGAGSLGDRVWFDANANAAQDPGEPGFANVPLQLLLDFDANGTTDATLVTTTNSSGLYAFNGLPAGAYVVQVTTPPAFTTQTFDLNGALDNQSTQTLAPGQSVQTHDFGYRGSGSLGDFVWFDQDADGVQDPGEPGIANVQVSLAVDLNGDGTADYSPSQTTDAAGGYLFTNLVPGTYVVTVNSATLPADFATHPTFDADGTGTPHVSIVALTDAAPTNVVQDFGYRGTGVIGDTVFFDTNGNGVQQPGEPGIPGVPVTLSGDFDGDGIPETFNTTTGAAGFYSFGNLPAATWTVTVGTPAGTSPTTDLTGDFVPDVANTIVLLAGQQRLDQDFGFRGAGTIGDRTWLDQDSDGVQDVGEAGITGLLVALDVDFNLDGTFDGTFNTPTGANGAYLFSNLAAANYRVRVTPLASTSQTYDADGTASANQSSLFLGAGQSNVLQDFGYVGSASIGDRVWFDANANAAQDVGEPGLPGVPVRLLIDYDANGSPDAQLDTTTNSVGLYSFPGLPAGAYVVQVTPPAGTAQTFDLNGGLDNLSAQTLVAGQVVVTHDFGYRGLGSLGDFVWFDQDADGVQDASEPGIANVQVFLAVDLNGDGSADYSTNQLTNSAGGYQFDNLVPGTYVVTVNTATLPIGMAAQPTFDADGVGTPHVSQVTLTVGAPSNFAQDFGYRGTGRIGDTIFFDVNGDGVQQGGEPGIPGVVVTLTGDFDNDGLNESLPTTTGANGFYQFPNLPPTAWTVTVTPPAGTSPTTDLTGDGVPDVTHTITLGLGQQRLDQDFGFRGTGQIGDRVWFDQDADGTQDALEFGYPGVGVALDVDFNLDGTFDGTLTTTTGANGAYLYNFLPQAQYRVRVTQPAGTTQTFDADGTGTANESSLFLAGGAQNLLQDFGYVGSGALGDRVWWDANADALQTGGEPGLPNVPVQLQADLNSDGTVDGVIDVSTDANGLYQFTALPPGQYAVVVTPPAGTAQSYDLDGTLDNRSTQTLAAGQSVQVHDFGYRGVGTLGDYVWFDADADGTQDAGEFGLANVQVTITIDVNGDGSTDYSTSTTTDSSGGYLFSNLIPGTYVVTVNTATLPAGMAAQPTFDADGTGTPHVSLATLTVGAPNNLVQDFGYRGTGRIGDTVFFDPNGNGIQDAGDPGIPGVTVTLSADLDADGIVETLTTTTGAGGFYLFDNLPPAVWTVTSATPAGGTPTTDLTGDTVPDVANTLSLAVGQERLDQDFGFRGVPRPGPFEPIPAIGNRVWIDVDQDGVQDPGEPGINGRTVTLEVDFNLDGIYDGSFTRTTAGDGEYFFDYLLGANYRVTVSPLPGTVPTFDFDGTATPHQSLLTLAPSDLNLLQDFGYVGAGTIAWEKRADILGSPLLGGATFQITPSPYTGTGTLTVADGGANDQNGVAGQFLVNRALPGTYVVTEITPPAGYLVDDDPDRTVFVMVAALNAVIGTQGVFDAGNSDASDFLNPRRNILVVSQDKSPATPQYVRIIDRDTGVELIEFTPYETSFNGGARVAVGDLTGDGVDEIIVAPGRGRAPEVRVFSQTGVELTQFRTLAYPSSNVGGVHVAVGDVNGDGKIDLVTVPSSGNAEVRVWYNQSPAADPLPNTPSVRFTAFTGNGGGSVGVADMGRRVGSNFGNVLDGKAEIVVGTGPGVKAAVKVYSNVSSGPVVVSTFNPFGTSKYANGVTLSTGRLNGDAFPDILVASENANNSEIREWLWNGNAGTATLALGGSFQPFGDLSSKTAPARVTGLDMNGDGIVEQLASVQGPGGTVGAIRLFNVTNPNPLTTVQQSPISGVPGPYFIATIQKVSPALPVPALPSGESAADYGPQPALVAVTSQQGSASASGVLTDVLLAPLDVNRDGHVSATDALLVINQLNSVANQGNGQRTTDATRTLDVNGDGYVSAVDVLMILNVLNAAADGNVNSAARSAGSMNSTATTGAVDAAFADW